MSQPANNNWTTDSDPIAKGFFTKLYWQVKRWIPILRTVSVEPAAFLMLTATLMNYLMYQNVLIDTICRKNLNYSEEICSEIVKVNPNYTEQETEVQKIAATIRTYRSIIDHSIPILFVLFVGPWSDFYGRKLPLLLGPLGAIIQSLVLVLYTQPYFKEIDAYLMYHNISVDGYLLSFFVGIPKALCGGEVGFTMAAYSYISDRTDASTRTIRTGLLSAGYTLGVPVGFAIGGALTKAGIGTLQSFAIAAAVGIVGLLIVCFRVDNVPASERNYEQNNDEKINESQSQLTETKERTGLWKILNPKYNFVGLLSILLKPRPSYGTIKIWLLIITFVCVAGPIHGEFGVMFLFLRKRLGWDSGDYGMFSTYNSLIGVTGVVVSMGILSHWLKLSDPIVGFISGMSQMGGCFIYAFAYTVPMMFLAPTVDMMNGTMAVVARSMLSKIVDKNEVGKLFSFIAILESLVPLAMDPLYSTIYRLTLESFEGCFMLLSAALTVPPQLIYLLFIIMNFNRSRNQNLENDGMSKDDMSRVNPAFSTDSISCAIDKRNSA